MDNLNTINDILLENIGVKLEEKDFDKKLNIIDEWDSLKHVQFIVELESNLNFQFEADESESGNTINKVNTIINNKVNK